MASFLNRSWAAIHALGITPNYLVTLEVTGRRSGRTISLPLVMTIIDGKRYLVSMLGAEAAGCAMCKQRMVVRYYVTGGAR